MSVVFRGALKLDLFRIKLPIYHALLPKTSIYSPQSFSNCIFLENAYIMSEPKIFIIVVVGMVTAACSSIPLHPMGSSTSAQANINLCRIMPLGDSITARAGYRQPLWLSLDAAGHKVDFVGSEITGQGGRPIFDPDNAGFSGISDEQIATLLETGWDPRNKMVLTYGPYMETFPTDIVLLHIGTNGLDADPQDVEKILEVIDQSDKEIIVILARIINVRCSIDTPPCNDSSRTKEFNDNVEAMVRKRVANGDKIIMVDMQDGAGIDYQRDMVDNEHPNESGFQKMAAAWKNALVNINVKIKLSPNCNLIRELSPPASPTGLRIN